MQLKWGIVGTGRICQDFCLALLTCHADEHRIVAVGSRTQQQADGFVKDLSLDDDVRTYSCQSDIFNDPHVDIVYIGTIEQVHHEQVIQALRHNKHVLCEKPLAMNEQQVQDMIDTAKIEKNFRFTIIYVIK
jgi:dihydrodiol dehydrogenase / D-xylose 1-dehydrogenase (NADP)